jgi:Tfp pilus assembly protein PilF
MDDHWLKPTYLLGILYNWQGQYYNAIQQFEKLLELCRKWGKEYMQNSSVWEGLGKAYHQTGQFKKAKKIYRKGLRYMPGEPQIIARQALLSFTEKDTVAALHYLGEYEKSIRKNEWSAAKIADGLGDIYAEAGLPDKAEIYYRKALSLEPDNPERFKAIITLFIENNRSLDESQLFIDRAMNLAGNQCRYYEFMDLKGKCLLKQGRVDEALTIIEKAWNEAPFKLYAIRSHLEEVKRAAAMHK